MSKSDYRITITVDPELHRRIKEASDQDDHSISVWVRRCCRAALKMPLKVMPVKRSVHADEYGNLIHEGPGNVSQPAAREPRPLLRPPVTGSLISRLNAEADAAKSRIALEAPPPVLPEVPSPVLPEPPPLKGLTPEQEARNAILQAELLAKATAIGARKSLLVKKDETS